MTNREKVQLRRSDLCGVEPYIERLLEIGAVFKWYQGTWISLKDESIDITCKLGEPHRFKLENVYAKGRDIAISMIEALCSIDADIAKYPSLTRIITTLEKCSANAKKLKDIPLIAQEACDEKGIGQVGAYSIFSMITLFKDQLNLIEEIISTLNILKSSDLYKHENGIPIMKDKSQINVSGVTNSSINIQSEGATANVSNTYNDSSIFSEMIAAIQSQHLDSETSEKLITEIKALVENHRKGRFKDGYKNFAQNVATHMTIIGPFIPALSRLL